MPHTVYIFNILVMWAVGVTSICIMAFVAMHATRGREPGNNPGTAFDSPQLKKLGLQFNQQARSWSLENRQPRISGRQGYPKR